MLELKIENLTATSKEMSDLGKKQLHELETRLSNSTKIEKELRKENEEVNKKLKEEKDKFIEIMLSFLNSFLALIKRHIKLGKGKQD